MHRSGPIPFDDVVETALYGEGGFYASGRGAGRSRDFLTSPEVGPLFGAVLGRALDSWWDEIGSPDPFLVVEVGAGVGTLCRDIVASRPRCTSALRYLLVERSDALRDQHAAHVPVEPAAFVLGPTFDDGVDEDGLRHAPGRGPLFASLPDLPAVAIRGVILANELFDNMAFRLVERTPEGWAEVRAGATADGPLAEVLVPADPALAQEADRLVGPDVDVSARIPLQHAAGEWLGRARRALEGGRIVAIDYATPTYELARRPSHEWVRTYRGGGRGGRPLEALGSQDITCEVCPDQLARIASPTQDRSQADFLRAHGVEALVDQARADWAAGAATGSLDGLKAQSRVGEANALLDPAGLGGFRVLEWVRN